MRADKDAERDKAREAEAARTLELVLSEAADAQQQAAELRAGYDEAVRRMKATLAAAISRTARCGGGDCEAEGGGGEGKEEASSRSVRDRNMRLVS